MDSSPSGFYLSSGRRQRGSRSGCLIASGVVLIVALVAVFELLGNREDQTPEAIPPSATPTPTASATPTSSPTPAEFFSEFVKVAPTNTPTPWVPAAQAPRKPRKPSPTPSASQCIRARWNARQSLAARGNVHVEINATNRCRRVIQPTEVWFRVTGYKQGQLIQTAHGSPFDEIWPNRSVDFGIGLPGSLDWYDEIVVEVND